MLELNDVHQRAGEALKVAESKAMQAMIQTPSAANVAAFEKAHMAVEAFQARQAQGQAEAGEAEVVGERAFKNPRQVAAFLSGQGWKLSENTAYNHRDRGLLRPGKGGFYREPEVLRYAANNLKRKDGSGPESLEALQAKKVRAEIAQAEARAAKMTLQQEILEGKFVRRIDYEHDLATRARLLKSDMINWAREHVELFIELVSGDPSRAPEALAFTERHIEGWLDHYANQGQIQIATPEGRP